MAAPMPPVAPVTSAVLPARSNSIGLLLQFGGAGANILRRGESERQRVGGIAARQAAQDFAGAEFTENVDPARGHGPHAFAPSHRGGDLRYEIAPDLLRIGEGCG